ncbi:MAG: hypothetical protein GPJ54_14690 [Candidatus Heimdallarchaeota archaeon]|nr:hypothetical protein [Candidatus Heimdallarchaeota archaeon]
MDKNHGKPSSLILLIESSSEGEDDRSTDFVNKSKTLLASQEVVATPDSVCGT